MDAVVTRHQVTLHTALAVRRPVAVVDRSRAAHGKLEGASVKRRSEPDRFLEAKNRYRHSRALARDTVSIQAGVRKFG